MSVKSWKIAILAFSTYMIFVSPLSSIKRFFQIDSAIYDGRITIKT